MLQRFAVGSMRVLWLALILAASAGAQSGASPETHADPTRVVLSVGEEKFTAADMDRFIQALPGQHRAFYGGPGKAILPQYVVKMRILAAEARKRHLEAQPEVQQAIAIATDSILADAGRKQLEQTVPVTNHELEELYEKRKPEWEEVRIRRILLRTTGSLLTAGPAPNRSALHEEEARRKLEELRRQGLAGADFAELAQEHSDDLATAGVGGDLGYVNRQKVVPPIAEAAYSLPVGQVSDIIPTPFGLELIKVEDRRLKPFAEVRAQLEAEIRKQKLDQLIEKLEKEYGVVIDTNYFGSPPEAPRPQSQD